MSPASYVGLVLALERVLLPGDPLGLAVHAGLELPTLTQLEEH